MNSTTAHSVPKLPAVPSEVAAGQVVAWMWQHEETGRVGFIDQWQIDNGWQKANPRLRLIRPLVFADGVKGPSAAQHFYGEVLEVVNRYLPPDGIDATEAMNSIVGFVDASPSPVADGVKEQSNG